MYLLVAFFLSVFLTLLIGKPFIRFLQKWQVGQVIRQSGPETHYSKKGTPTMGGLLIIVVMTLVVAPLGDWRNPLVLMGMATLWLFAGIGFLDDYAKLILKHSKGLASRYKYLLQSLFGLVIAVWFLHYFKSVGEPLFLSLPFTDHVIFLSPIAFVCLAYLVIVGASNAVNLTDGLDGLSILSIIPVAFGLGMLAFLHPNVAAREETLLCMTLIGAGLGFWWFNAYPATLFMGDVGALAFGAFFGFIAISLHMELALLIMGGIFVIETLSVILQVGSYRLRNKKRIFKMAPIHHHFELLGLHENKVVARFTLITTLLVLFGLYGFIH